MGEEVKDIVNDVFSKAKTYLTQTKDEFTQLREIYKSISGASKHS